MEGTRLVAARHALRRVAGGGEDLLKRDLGALVGREHDLLVVGGGIYGAAAAWDAAQRGLAVALIEARDFGSGTSWNSSKTIHGGLRHLQRADLASFRESIRERRALLRIAPELVRPLPFLVPTYGHGPKGREVLSAGVRLNDLLGADRNRGLPAEQQIPRGRILSPGEVRTLVPGLAARGLTGGVVWTDAQVTSSERLLLGFLHAAASAGAVLANYVEATGLLRCRHRIAGVRARDAETGASLEARARIVLSAAGPSTDRLVATAGVARAQVPLLLARNLVLRRRVVTTHALGAASAGRFLYLVPWRDCTILGTSYEPAGAAGQPAEAARGLAAAARGPAEAAREGVAAFLAEARRAYPWAGLDRDAVTLVHEGLVPGSGGASGLWTRNRLVDHGAEDAAHGLLSVVGVKYTTARSAAEKAVDLAFARLGRAQAPCRTAETPLPARALRGSLEEQTRHALREEMALHLADVALRRIDLGTAGPPAEDALDAVARTVAAELAWSEERLRDERRALAEAYVRV